MANKKSSARKKEKYTKEDLTKIRKRLMQERGIILDELVRIKMGSLRKSQKEASGDLSGYSFHMADMATDLYDREFILGLAEGEREMLYSLDEAIKRVEDGTYGKCDACGQLVSKKRLKAMPQAQCCLECQEKKEKSVSK